MSGLKLSSIKIYFVFIHFLNWCCRTIFNIWARINFQSLQLMAGTFEFVQVVLKLHIVVTEFLYFRSTLCWWFPFIFPVCQDIPSWKKQEEEKKWKCHQTEKTVLIYWYLPVLTESESKESSFFSFIRADVSCWFTSVAIWGFFWCWWNSNVSSLSSHWETLSNLSFDDSSISTFFTINFVVRLLVSIFESSLSLQLNSCTF